MQALLHGIGSYESGDKIGPACWPHFDLIVVTEGAVDFHMGRKTMTVAAGDACLIPPGNRFLGTAGVEGATTWVQHFRILRKTGPEILAAKRPLWLRGAARGEWIRSLLRRGNHLQNRRQTTASRRAVDHLLALLIEEFDLAAREPTGRAGSENAQVEKAIYWAENHRTPLPTIAGMAAEAGWSVNHFREKFREVRRQTVGAYLRALNLEEAKLLLRETRLPIKEIAARLGYGDLVAFHRAFTRQFRLTPARCRKMNDSVKIC